MRDRSVIFQKNIEYLTILAQTLIVARSSLVIVRVISVITLVFLTGCFKIGGNWSYKGPPTRPEAFNEYYKENISYSSYSSTVLAETKKYVHNHIVLDTPLGPVVLDYFRCKEQKNNNLVLVFPILGGKNIIERHFAGFFAEHELDAVVVNRNNEFKDPQKFDELESIFKNNVIRDRIALDFFEREFHKQNFGTFGISRGAINVALTAGVDPRLKYNVMVLGGSDIVDLFRDSNQKRIKEYIEAVSKSKGLSEDQFFEHLKKIVVTAPENTARYIDSRNSLLILGIFDKTVPFEYGLRLRKQMGYPATIFLTADHYFGLLYTQTASFLPPRMGPGYFPFPYIEQEAVSFFRKKFEVGGGWGVLPYRILQAPVNLIAEAAFSVGNEVLRTLEPDSEKVTPGYWDKGTN